VSALIFDLGREDWLRARRRRMALCVIHYLNLRLGGITKKDIEKFLNFLEKIDPEIYGNIKPTRSLEYTLNEPERNGIVLVGDKIEINRDKVKSEKDLIYWKSIGSKIEEAFEEYRKVKGG
jgi:hypothetical protein